MYKLADVAIAIVVAGILASISHLPAFYPSQWPSNGIFAIIFAIILVTQKDAQNNAQKDKTPANQARKLISRGFAGVLAKKKMAQYRDGILGSKTAQPIYARGVARF